MFKKVLITSLVCLSFGVSFAAKHPTIDPGSVTVAKFSQK